MSIDVRNLTLQYALPGGKAVNAVTETCLRVDNDEILGIVGESGCGKSTLAYSIIQVLPKNAIITHGEVLFNGKDLLKLDELQLQDIRWTRIAMVFQSSMNAFSPVHRIVEQLAAVHMTHLGSTKREALHVAEKALISMGIPESRVRSYPHEFSGGMRQRAAIALALLLDPDVLIADEPTTALDVVVQDRILGIIQDWQRENGRAVIFVSHDIAVIAEVCDRIAVMYAGLIVETADKTKLLGGPRHPYTEALLECVPSLQGGTTRLLSLPGTPPDLSEPHEGCLFRPRCPKAFAECATVRPELYLTEEGHLARCLLYRSEAP